jgi:PAS domain S-box-containing protein
MIRHRDIFNIVRDAIFIADTNTGMIVDANCAAETLCGRSLEELRSMHHTQLHPPESANRALQVFGKHTLVPGLVEGLILHKDGHRVPVEIATSHFTDAEGRSMLVGVFRETTERDGAWEALRQSEERFRQVAESAGEFIWEVDAAGLYVYASPVISQILGYTPEEIVGRMHFYDFFVPESRETMKKAAFDTFARKAPFRAFFNLNLRKDGTIVTLETSGLPILDRNGNLLGYRGADTDVTERKRAEAALRESEDRYRTLFDQAADSVFLLDLSAGIPMIVDANEAAVKSYGYSREEMIGQPISLIEPEISQASLDARMRLIAEGKPFDIVHRRKDGSTFEVESAARLVRIGPQEVLLAVGRDITQRKQAEEELARDFDAMTRLQKLGELSVLGSVEPVLTEIVDTAIAISGADFGNIQLLDPISSDLRIAAHRGFPPWWLEFWSSAAKGKGACGTALERGERVIVEDVEKSQIFSCTPALDTLRRVGVRSVQSTPLISRSGKAVGMFSTHYRTQGRPEDRVLRLLDLLARQAADIIEHSLAEAALRESEERFRATFDQAAVGIAHVGLDGRFLRVNRRFCQIVGYSQQQMLERTFQEITHPDDLEADVEQMRCLLRGEIETYSMEKRYIRGDGGLVWVDLTVAVVRDQNGDPGWFVSVVQDISERKEAEDALRRSEERFRFVTENLQDAVWSADLSGRYEFLSPNMERIYGRPLAEMVANPAFWIEAAHPEDKAKVQASGDALLRNGHIELEYRILLPDGTERWISDRKTHLLDAHGKPFRIAGILSNITERKRTEEILAASEEKYRALVETTNTGYRITDKDGKVIDANQEYVRLTGHSELGEILGRSVLEWTAPHDKQKNAESLARCVKDGFARNLVIDYVGRDNRVTPVEINATVTANGEPMRIISLCRDITERKRAEDSMRASEERFRALADSALVGIYILQDGKYSYVNPAMAAVFGYTVAEMTGMTPDQIVHPSHHALVGENIRRRISGEVPAMRYEVVGRYRDGSVREVEVYGSTVQMNGRPALVGTLLDITERKRAERDRERLQQELGHAQRMECVGRLAGGIAHDFNNLMSVVLMHASSALDDLTAKKSVEESLMAIQEAAETAVNLGRQLMVFSSKQVVQAEVLNLNSVIGDSQKLVRRLIGEDVKVVFQPGPGLFLVRADRGQIGQILMNLAVNSRDAMPEGGTFTVETAAVQFDNNPSVEAEPGSYASALSRIDPPLLSKNDPQRL